MEKYSRYYGVMIFVGIVLVTLVIGFFALLNPKIAEMTSINEQITSQQDRLTKLQLDKKTVEGKLKKMKDSLSTVKKRVYAPTVADLGSDSNDAVFYTLYNDLIEMIRTNSIKVKSMQYTYNPEDDDFVKYGGADYFVTEIDMELVSNYVNLGKFIESLHQYAYYLKIMDVEVTPYEKDKKILLTTMKLRLYASTAPEEEVQPTMPKA
ncbi:MAG: hypothetical protein MJ237_01475 [bacterium]|nr:hypothetical protein [bacterium]